MNIPVRLGFLQFFSVRGFEALFPCAGALSCVVCLAPQLFLLVYPYTNVGPSSLPDTSLPGPPVATSPGPPGATLPPVFPALATCFCPSYWYG